MSSQRSYISCDFYLITLTQPSYRNEKETNNRTIKTFNCFRDNISFVVKQSMYFTTNGQYPST